MIDLTTMSVAELEVLAADIYSELESRYRENFSSFPALNCAEKRAVRESRGLEAIRSYKARCGGNIRRAKMVVDAYRDIVR